jgi:hypothetical protein
MPLTCSADVATRSAGHHLMAYWVPLADTASHTFTWGVLQIMETLLHCRSSCLQATASSRFGNFSVSAKQQSQPCRHEQHCICTLTFYPLCRFLCCSKQKCTLLIALLCLCADPAAYLALLLLFMTCLSQRCASDPSCTLCCCISDAAAIKSIESAESRRDEHG